MGTLTTVAGLYKPDVGEQHWGEEVDANWDVLDTIAAGVIDTRGDARQVYVATAGQRGEVRVGTAASPDTNVHPVTKVTRTVAMPRASLSGDGGEQMAAIVGVTYGVASNQGQVVGLYGGAVNVGTSNGGSGGVDSVGVYGVGIVKDTGVGVGIGGFFNGRREVDTAKATGIEVSVDNETLTAGVFSSSTFSDTIGIWLHGTGTAAVAAGLVLANPFNVQMDYGIAALSQGTGGPIITATFADFSSAATSLLINGSHATAAIAVGFNSGAVILGSLSALQSSSRLEVRGSTTASSDPLMLIGQATGSFSHSLWIRNSQAVAKIAVCGATNSFVTGTVAGDLVIYNSTGGTKGVHIAGAASSAIHVSGNADIGLYGVTPVGQYSTTGTSTGFTAGAGTTVTHLSTFTGGIGSTAYTIGDIVRALKLLGPLAQ